MSLSLDRNVLISCVLLALGGCAANLEPSDDLSHVAVTEGQALSLCPSDVPAAIAVPAGNKLVMALDAVGDQVYVCRANATGFGWTLLAPDADLFKPGGGVIGSHYAGPTWEAIDGSFVVGARVAGVTVDTTAIPQLLLRAASNSASGAFSQVTFIQRLRTTAGLAPTTGCDADHLNQTHPVAYTATYYFYGSASSPAGVSCQ